MTPMLASKLSDWTEADFQRELLGPDKLVVVDFWAPWCGPCRMLEPVLEEVASEFGDRAVIGRIDVDENPGLAARYGIRSLPTLAFFRNGKVVDGLVGVVSKGAIVAKLLDRAVPA